MNIIRQIYIRITEITLLGLLIILPFSYKKAINIQWIIFFSILLGICIFIQLSKKIKPANYNILGVIFALFFMFIFDSVENVDIIKRIPLSTVLIAIGMFFFMIKIIAESKVKIIRHPFMKYFFYACAFLFVLMVLFYPFFSYHYQMSPDSDIHLLSNIVKYVILFILVINYLSDEKKFKTINLGFIFSLTVTIGLCILT